MNYTWIRLTKHCEATGDTPDAVHARRRKRIWTDGVHCGLGPDGNLYINPQEYNKWVQSKMPQGQNAPEVSASGRAN
jgi:hypothetical protein